MKPQTSLISTIANLIQARQNCLASNSGNWFQLHTDRLRQIERDLLPRGSGIDAGTTIDLDRSTADRVVFCTSFHHMTEHGFYDGWTEHTIIVRPSFIGGLSMRITGRDRNSIKEYLSQAFDHDLAQTIEYSKDDDRYTLATIAV